MSSDRATFRGIVTDGVCHQRRVREAAERDASVRAVFPSPPRSDLSLKRSRVKQISRAMAWKIIARYEWLGTLPPQTNRFYGIFFGDFCGGVACYCMGWRHAGIGFPGWLRADKDQIAYLARGACVHWAPKGTAPRLINHSAKMTGLEVAVAFSDTDAGEIGTVYQAAGWDCLGFGSTHTELVSPEGKILNVRVVTSLKRRHNADWKTVMAKFRSEGWTEQQSNPKLRYVKLLPAGRKNPDLLARIAESGIPYPKRQTAGSR